MQGFTRSKTSKRVRGSAMADVAPALFVLMFFFVLPIINLMGLGLTYGACAVLNDLQGHEAALSSPSQAQDPSGAVQKTIVQNWRASGLGIFLNPNCSPVTAVSYKPGMQNAEGKPNLYVTVTTTISCKPVLTVPFFDEIPGLGAPVNLIVSNERLVENSTTVAP